MPTDAKRELPVIRGRVPVISSWGSDPPDELRGKFFVTTTFGGKALYLHDKGHWRTYNDLVHDSYEAAEQFLASLAPTPASPADGAEAVTAIPEQHAKAALDAAIWVTCSPHEWVWTHDQQIAMARYCIEAAKQLGIIAQAKALLETIVCTAPPDDGVVLLSNEGPTHMEPGVSCPVYDHVHFSPLGDALIALHDILSGNGPKDDDELLTEEWLTTQGGGDKDTTGVLISWECDWGWLQVAPFDNAPEWHICGNRWHDGPRARGQFRKLSAALALKLPPSPSP